MFSFPTPMKRSPNCVFWAKTQIEMWRSGAWRGLACAPLTHSANPIHTTRCEATRHETKTYEATRSQPPTAATSNTHRKHNAVTTAGQQAVAEAVTTHTHSAKHMGVSICFDIVYQLLKILQATLINYPQIHLTIFFYMNNDPRFRKLAFFCSLTWGLMVGGYIFVGQWVVKSCCYPCRRHR